MLHRPALVLWKNGYKTIPYNINNLHKPRTRIIVSPTRTFVVIGLEGEHLLPMERIPLTQTVQKGGCAAKVSATELRQILQRVTFPPAHTALLVDGGLFDDAAIYKVTDDLALV